VKIDKKSKRKLATSVTLIREGESKREQGVVIEAEAKKSIGKVMAVTLASTLTFLQPDPPLKVGDCVEFTVLKEAKQVVRLKSLAAGSVAVETLDPVRSRYLLIPFSRFNVLFLCICYVVAMPSGTVTAVPIRTGGAAARRGRGGTSIARAMGNKVIVKPGFIQLAGTEKEVKLSADEKKAKSSRPVDVHPASFAGGGSAKVPSPFTQSTHHPASLLVMITSQKKKPRSENSFAFRASDTELSLSKGDIVEFTIATRTMDDTLRRAVNITLVPIKAKVGNNGLIKLESDDPQSSERVTYDKNKVEGLPEGTQLKVGDEVEVLELSTDSRSRGAGARRMATKIRFVAAGAEGAEDACMRMILPNSFHLLVGLLHADMAPLC
jgi:CxxC motif-containing protein